MALAPPVPNQSGQVRHELMVTRLAHRLGLRQETVWARLAELRTERRRKDAAAAPHAPATRVPTKADPVYALELTLLRLLIADPDLDAHNADPKPFNWVAEADAMLDRIKRVCERTSDSGH